MYKEVYLLAREVFEKNGGFAQARELISVGLSSGHVARLTKAGSIVRVKRGLYRWHKTDSSCNLAEACRIVPDGVVCLLSALSLHEIGTKEPWEIHLAIPRKARSPILPSYPPIRLAYFSKLQYQVGLVTVDRSGVSLPVYDIEKTLCDCARYRSKIGYDVFREAVGEYLRRPGRNIDKLLAYARQLRVWSVIAPVVEALA